MAFTLLPAVDVAGGRAVRHVQGDASNGTYSDPRDAALAWQAAGADWIHLVDLDAAFGRGSNTCTVKSLVTDAWAPFLAVVGRLGGVGVSPSGVTYR